MWIKLYLDEDTQRNSLTEALIRRGVDVLTTSQANRVSHADDKQLEFAASVGRTIYTFNVKDFLLLHSNFLEHDKPHAGIIIGEQGRFGVGEQMRRLLRIIEAKSAEDMHDDVEFLSSWG